MIRGLHGARLPSRQARVRPLARAVTPTRKSDGSLSALDSAADILIESFVRHVMRIRSHRSRPAAFSLVELLVVLGIISLLIGILLPVTAKARREARKTACKAQLANVGAAMQM